ncbi:glycoside hydrolase family 17 protein [Piedraia hortae CBS 480.64]|uniref:Glycoside hydrolase family 17 protein n=1 Tax=Piedraia hortae CBS 480.64 TaxID=1314780 RepID=A0A6A7C400_9PEZI|nr:glycoside hydrolase family 17 protein [Piedraia hortae CBS 480.64]
MKAGLLLLACLSAATAQQANRGPYQVVGHASSSEDTTTVIVEATGVPCMIYVNKQGSTLLDSCKSSFPIGPPASKTSTSATSTSSLSGYASSSPSTFSTSTSSGSSSSSSPSISSTVTSLSSSSSAVSTSSMTTSSGVSSIVTNSSTSSSSSSAAPSPSTSSPSSAGPSLSGYASGFKGYSISYSPFHSTRACKDQDAVNKDMEALSGYGMVRIYGTDCNQTATVVHAAKAKGMKVFAGVYDINSLAQELHTLIDSVNGDWDPIEIISIGNEGVNDGRYSVAQVVSAIEDARLTLKSAGYQGKVVTVDTFVATIAHPELCKASDFAAVNCHPFFDGHVAADDAGKWVLQQTERVSQACGGKSVMVTETGWPWKGNPNGVAVPSVENQAAALKSLRSSFTDMIVFFSAYNDLWKQNNAGTYGAENYWGIYGNAPS